MTDFIPCLFFVLLLVGRNFSEPQSEEPLLDYKSSEPPPEEIPLDYKDAFTMNGEVPIEYYYVDDSNAGQGTHYKFSWNYMEEMVEKNIPEQIAYLKSRHFVPAKEETKEYAKEDRDQQQERLDALFMTLLHKNYWPLVSMVQHPHFFDGAKVAVFGSLDPYFENVALYLGAIKVTTFEYNHLTFGDINDEDNDVLEVVTGDRYDALLRAAREGGQGNADYSRFRGHFDIVLSFSSFDHSGLGRYGDEIDGGADLAAMSFAGKVTKTGGHLFLTLPVGPDVTVWNLQRRYGSKRLPLMLRSFFEGENCDTSNERSENGTFM